MPTAQERKSQSETESGGLTQPLLNELDGRADQLIPNTSSANQTGSGPPRPRGYLTPNEGVQADSTRLPSRGCCDGHAFVDIDGQQSPPCPEAMSIVEGIRLGDLKRAEDAFESAEHLALDSLHDDDKRDILAIALEKNCRLLVRLVLEKLALRAASILETTRILNNNFETLQQHFPDLTNEFFLEKDMFCFKIGEMPVESRMFPSQECIVETSDTLPNSWKLSKDETEGLFPKVDAENQSAAGHGSNQVTAALNFVPIEGIAKSEKSGLVQSLLVKKAPVQIFESKLIEWVTHWKWNKIWKLPFCMFVALNVILVASFSVFSIQHNHRLYSSLGEHDGKLLRRSVMEAVYLRISYIITAIFFVQELVLLINSGWNHGREGMFYWLSSPWKWARIACGVLMLVCCSLVVWSHDDGHIGEAAVAIECVAIWIAGLYYLQPLSKIGPLVAAVRRVLHDIVPFLAMGLIVLMGFSIASFSLNPDGNFKHLPRAAEAFFFALLGDFDPYADGHAHSKSAKGENGEDCHHYTHAHYRSDQLARGIVLDLFLLFEGIILYSLLFAIMNKSYDRVKENENAELNRCRAMVINDCEATFSMLPCLRKAIERKTKKYLYALVPEKKDRDLDRGRSWTRTLQQQIEETIKKLVQQGQNDMKEMVKSLLTSSAEPELDVTRNPGGTSSVGIHGGHSD